MPKNNVYGGFSQALFFSGSISIPRFFLDHYSELGMNDREMMLVIHIINEVSNNNDIIDIENKIVKKMGISVLEYRNTIQSLQTKGLILDLDSTKSKPNQSMPLYNFNGLIDQLFEIWGIRQFKQIEAIDNDDSKKISSNITLSLSTLVTLFEQELGRPLTGFECENIEKWLLASYSEELIIEALRRGVSAGIRSFRYLDSILREWEKKGLHTRQEVEDEDKNFQNRREKKADNEVKNKRSNKKYDDIYL